MLLMVLVQLFTLVKQNNTNGDSSSLRGLDSRVELKKRGELSCNFVLGLRWMGTTTSVYQDMIISCEDSSLHIFVHLLLE